LTLARCAGKSAAMTARAFITGVSGLTLTAKERAFVRDAAPWGLIVFRRNVNDRGQLHRLVDSFREAAGGPAPVLVDQEGGRVQRLAPPHWPAYPPGAAYGRLFDRDRAAGLAAARLGARLIAADLTAVGIDVDTLPIADVPAEGADDIIGDRAYGETADNVAAIASAIVAGLREGGVLPVLKHLPGHGRATADSHVRLPVVSTDRATLEATDFAAFRPLAGLPMAMTAHVVYSAIDRGAPATVSATIVHEVIRESIGFSGLLMSDDISMGALSGSISARTAAALAAGCDIVLHCNGDMAEMQDVAAAAPLLSGEAARRADAALAARTEPAALDIAAARADFSAMMAAVWPAAATVTAS
jgi:beta-N-acetylhexosaminidase